MTNNSHNNDRKMKGNYQDFNNRSAGTNSFGQSQEYFGISSSGRAVRIKLFFKDGRRLSVPYALLPLIGLSESRELTISMSELSITIRGRGLQVLEEYLSQELVEFIKESATSTDDLEYEVFISEILLDGELPMNF